MQSTAKSPTTTRPYSTRHIVIQATPQTLRWANSSALSCSAMLLYLHAPHSSEILATQQLHKERLLYLKLPNHPCQQRRCMQRRCQHISRSGVECMHLFWAFQYLPAKRQPHEPAHVSAMTAVSSLQALRKLDRQMLKSPFDNPVSQRQPNSPECAVCSSRGVAVGAPQDGS